VGSGDSGEEADFADAAGELVRRLRAKGHGYTAIVGEVIERGPRGIDLV